MPTQSPSVHSMEQPDDMKKYAPKENVKKMAGKKILWVEDDKFLGSIVQKRMSTYGGEMVLAVNGDDAFKYLEDHTPNAIVLDLVLPGMSGFDILKKVRDNDAFKKVPVLILSNLNQSSDIERAKILGAEKFLVKASVSLEEIMRQIQLLMK
ncbi:MAG: response regulator [bacterium]